MALTKTEKANAKLMRAAGFKRIYMSAPSFWIWGRGDLRVMTGPVRLTLTRLIEMVIEQAAYRMRRSASIEFKGFQTDNGIKRTKGE